MAVADVLLISKAALRDTELLSNEPPLSRVSDVSPGIQLAAVKDDVAYAVFHACKFRQLEPIDDQILYGFVRYDPPGTKWDDDQAISKALYLSHFVHAHEGGFQFAARIETDERRRVVRLEPADTAPAFARAYCCPDVRRRWLVQSEADELRRLISAYDDSREYLRDKKIGMAVSLFSETPFILQGRARLSILATTLEGLASSSPERAFKQFTVRVPAFAAEVGLPELDHAWAERMYKLRSKLAHGVPLFPSADDNDRRIRSDELNRAMTELDELLRRIIKRALLEREFAERINNLDIHWPVAGKGCPKCQSQDASLVGIQCPRCGGHWR